MTQVGDKITVDSGTWRKELTVSVVEAVDCIAAYDDANVLHLILSDGSVCILVPVGNVVGKRSERPLIGLN